MSSKLAKVLEQEQAAAHQPAGGDHAAAGGSAGRQRRSSTAGPKQYVFNSDSEDEQDKAHSPQARRANSGGSSGSSGRHRRRPSQSDEDMSGSDFEKEEEAEMGGMGEGWLAGWLPTLAAPIYVSSLCRCPIRGYSH